SIRFAPGSPIDGEGHFGGARRSAVEETRPTGPVLRVPRTRRDCYKICPRSQMTEVIVALIICSHLFSQACHSPALLRAPVKQHDLSVADGIILIIRDHA